MEVLPYEQAQFLYKISFLGRYTGLIGIVNGYWGLGTGVWIGSYLAEAYWKHPTYGFLRTLDITWVQLLLWTHLNAAYATDVFVPYVLIQLAGVGAYAISWHYHKEGDYWKGAYAHACVHGCSHLSVLLLYLSWLW
jgi:hypothetical protein